ncbi:hypothetical protein [Nonomuraea sp. NPDC049709]|uniref:hypothetical protein n=1 Tax=Nonomuraea sp. NPDC049709 TaxID=3154736 RepID=UPI0034479342
MELMELEHQREGQLRRPSPSRRQRHLLIEERPVPTQLVFIDYTRHVVSGFLAALTTTWPPPDRPPRSDQY